MAVLRRLPSSSAMHSGHTCSLMLASLILALDSIRSCRRAFNLARVWLSLTPREGAGECRRGRAGAGEHLVLPGVDGPLFLTGARRLAVASETVKARRSLYI